MNKLLLLVFVCVFCGCGCPYTEKDVIIPDFLKNATLVTEQDEYIAKGKDPDCCAGVMSAVKALRDIDNEIVEAETIKNITVGREYYERQGRTVVALPKGKSFFVARIIAQEKHGIEAIDSGPGPIIYLVLKDEEGILYKLAAVALGTNPGEPYMAYYINGKRQGLFDSSLHSKLSK